MNTRAWKFSSAVPCILVIALFTAILPVASAQSAAANGTLSGTVVDPQGSVVAGAQVTIRNTDLAFTRTITTDEGGNFTLPALPAGAYTVQVNATGFTLKRPPRIQMGVGSSVRITLKLDLAATRQEVTVTGRGATVEGNTTAPSVNKDDPAASNTIAGLTVTYLPNRNRDFSQFGQLAAGVVPDTNSSGLVIAGQRANAVKEAVDGGDFNDPLQGGQRGAQDGAFFFPQTVVREFQIVHAGAGSEVGETNAGFVNVVTKSGSNKFHGEGFYIGRPSWLTSEDTFGHSLDNVQNEFGGSFGGPIRKNRIFYYLGGEQDYLHVPYWTQFQQQAPGIVVPAFLSNLQHQIVATTSPTALFARTDFLLNSTNTLNLQANYNHIRAAGLNEGSTRTLAAQNHSGSLSGNSIWVRGTLATVFSPAMVNQLLAQWTRDTRNRLPNDNSPEIFINGFGVLGGNSLLPDRFTSDSRQISDDISISNGGKLLRVGAAFAYDPARQFREANLNGRFDFNSLADFLADAPRRYRQTFAGADALYRGVVRQLGVYISGKLPLRPDLTITGGLRWDGQWNPQPTNPNPAIPQSTFIPDDLGQWQPRLGIAWNPASNTVVRLSSGLYDAPTPGAVFQRVFTDNGLNTVIADSFFDPAILPLVAAPGFAFHALPAVPPGLTTPAALVVGVSPDFHNPRSFQFSGSVEQQLNRKLTVSAGYLRNSTWDLQQRLDRNLNSPTLNANGLPVFPALRPVPSVGQLLVNESNAHSSYDSFLLTANLQLPRRSQLMVNYTLSRTRDNDSSFGPFGMDSTLNPFNLAAERAYSSQDVRNNFNLSGVINLLWGLKVNPIIVARSGQPYTPVVGFDLQNDANDLNDRAIIHSLVAPRNVLRQPAFFNFDLRFVKDITLKGEGHHLDLFMDIFNITGAANRNFGPDATSFFGTPSSPVFTAGQPLFAPDTTRFGGARQVQFTARIVAF